jgi:hypothetical protein
MDLNNYYKSDFLGTWQEWMNFAILFTMIFFSKTLFLEICFGFLVIHIIPLFYSQTNALGPEK